MHTWALGTLCQNHKTAAFLTAGLYSGCRDKPNHVRNSLYYRNGEGTDNESLVDKFNLFQLTPNTVYVSPMASAAHLFKTKSSNTDDIKQRKKLESKVKKWKDSSQDGVYVAMPPEKGDTGDGEDDAVSVGSKTNVENDSRKLTKTRFKAPMANLGNKLQNCNRKLAK